MLRVSRLLDCEELEACQRIEQLREPDLESMIAPQLLTDERRREDESAPEWRSQGPTCGAEPVEGTPSNAYAPASLAQCFRTNASAGEPVHWT